MKRSPLRRGTTQLKRSRLNPVSKKRRKENRIRAEFTKEMLKRYPRCQIQSPVCTGRSEHVHEHLARSAGGARIPGEQADAQGQVFTACCDRCNEHVQNQHDWALEHGWKISRFRR